MEVNAPLSWQLTHWRRLQQQLNSGRLPHALLLQGVAGLGKTLFARALAARLLCATPDSDSQGLQIACGHCADCRQRSAGSHPDQRVVQPEAPGKPIRIEQVRRLAAFITGTRQRAGTKVALLLAADWLNTNAANALLKTLEEPPPTSLLILVGDAMERLPATVRSRCQRIVFQLPPQHLASDWLRSQLTVDADPEMLLRMAAGAPLRALCEADNLADRSELFADWQAVLHGERAAGEVAPRWVGDKSAQSISWLLSWHQDMIRLNMQGAAVADVVNSDLGPALAELAATLTGAELFRRLDGLQQLWRDQSTTVNLALQLTAWLAACAGQQSPDIG